MLKIVSLFCGIGGADIGVLGGFDYLKTHYEKLNNEIVFACDISKHFVNLYNKNFSHKALCADIRNLHTNDVPHHDLLIAGIPCQSFSMLNTRRKGINDEKTGDLFLEVARILKEKKPRFFIVENVRGLLSANNRQAFEKILKTFEEIGYFITYKVLCADDYAIPQMRKRLFIIGFQSHNDLNNFYFPTPTTTEEKVVTKAILEDESTIEEKYFYKERQIKNMIASKARKKFEKAPIQDIEKVCRTVTAKSSQNDLNSSNPVLLISKLRNFTARELARLQTFPDTYCLDVEVKKSLEGIGNAIPPVLMHHLVKEILRLHA